MRDSRSSAPGVGRVHRRALGAAANGEHHLQYLDSGEGGGRVCRVAPIAPKCAGQMFGHPPLIDL